MEISAASFSCQQRRFWTEGRPVISVAAMNSAGHRKAQPSPADLAAAERLKALWDAAVAESRQAGGATLTQDVPAEALGINQSAVSQYIRGKIPLNYRAVMAFAQILGVPPERIRDDLPEQKLNRVGEPPADYGEWADVTGYGQAVGLGAGAEAEEYAETHKLKFRASSLRRKGLRPTSLAVFYGRGDSMEPRIRENDAVLFDTSDTRPVDGGIFVVQLGPEINVKRCEIIDDIVYFRSDNPAGDHTWRKPRRMDNARNPITILGRVRWIGSWED